MKNRNSIQIKNSLIKKTVTNRLYQIPVPIIGLTGGIATGKSTVAKLFKKAGIVVIDADQLVKNIYQKDEVIRFIKDQFNQAIVDGNIDFKILRNLAFNSKDNITKIENEIYKYLPQEFLSEFQKNFNPSQPQFIIYDVPLLFEKGLDQFVDITVCVYVDELMQIKRLMQRDQIDELTAKKIISHQMPIDEKKTKSQFVIDNNFDLNQLNINIQNFLNQIYA